MELRINVGMRLRPHMRVVRPCHTRHRVRRLKAEANRPHSAVTLLRPRSRNLRAACCSLMIPSTGSTSPFLRRYNSLASSLPIQYR